MQVLKNFVVFEGCDGGGRSTQLELLRERFSNKANNKCGFTATFEPTDGELGQTIRKALAGKISLNAQTLAYLFAADRNEHLFGENGIEKIARNGNLVVCDRYVLSSLVYQGIECGDELPKLLNERFPAPEMTIFFDIDMQTAQKRMEDRQVKDIFEKLNFQIKVRERYKIFLEQFEKNGGTVYTVDSSKSIAEVEQEVWKHILKMPIFNM
ncbi:MAG: dTMP kinase [Spirochaetaceae bacterium]|jgi:dTMP kinase|nr:dTMP kinase [Spirochaetaceae bacterium]